jgi:hypothetical protein
VREHVQAEDDEDHSEQAACDDSYDFHNFSLFFVVVLCGSAAFGLLLF